MKVRTVVHETNITRCYLDHNKLGSIVVSQADTEFKAQNKAAKFLDANFPDETIEWVDGYHGGDTSSKTGDLLGHYNNKR